jgi:hypothetical protein
MANLVRKRVSGQRAIWISLFVLLIFMIAPIIYAVLASFKTNMEIFSSPFSLPNSWSFDNIISAWQVGNFQQYFLNSAFVTIGGMNGSRHVARQHPCDVRQGSRHGPGAGKQNKRRSHRISRLVLGDSFGLGHSGPR